MPRPKIYEDGLTPQQRYALKHRKLVSVNFYIPSEEDIYNHLQRQPNKQGYIKGLIRQDMEGQKEKK